MQAVTDFAATREHIQYAIKVFTDGHADEIFDTEEKRQKWIAEHQRKAWFGRSYKRWDMKSRGENGDIFERLRMDGFFNTPNLGWYADKARKATQLLEKFDCAVDNCEAIEVKLSDKDLELLSVCLRSALET